MRKPQSRSTRSSGSNRRLDQLQHLFPVQEGQRDIAGLKMIERDRILPKKQVRQDALKDLPGLTENIRELKSRNLGVENTGILQPLTVTPDREREGFFRLMYGHRRYFASDDILKELPCIVVESNEQAIYLTQGVENIQRQDLDILDEAEFVHTLREAFKLSIRNTAAMLGKHKKWIENRVYLHQADDDVKEFLAKNPDSSGATLTNMLLIQPVKDSKLRRRLFAAARDGATEKALKAIVDAHHGRAPDTSSASTPAYGQSSTPAGTVVPPSGDSGISVSHTSAKGDLIAENFQPAVAQLAAGVEKLKTVSITHDYRKRVQRELDLVRQQADIADELISNKRSGK